MFLTKKISVTAVVENTCMRHGLTSHHAQSLFLDFKGSRYLFDTSELFFSFKNNLDVLKILPQRIKAIAISHNHSDHIGSLADFLPFLDSQPIFLPATYSLINYPNKHILNKPLELEKDLWLTGPLGMEKEQALVIDLKKQGLIILVGCSHPTLPVIIKKARQITQNKRIFGIIGGFHFKGLTPKEINKYVLYLKSLNSTFIAPSHCTGFQGICALKKVLGEKVRISSTGSFGVGNSVELEPKLKFNFI
jgi:7,8-dihydropterin-6-yl-methyl-4-(beta-D-ribofuranosyl)aminobenzene 5'-phosphate synthase